MRWGGLGEERRRFPPEPIWRSAAAAAGRARLRGARGPLALRPGPDQARARLAPRVADMIRIACLHVPPGRDAGRLGVAPLALLDLGPEMAARLARWGIRTLGELADLPARGLAQRLGDEGPRLQRLARGEDPTPLRLWTPPPVFEESAEAARGGEALEPLGD